MTHPFSSWPHPAVNGQPGDTPVEPGQAADYPPAPPLPPPAPLGPTDRREQEGGGGDLTVVQELRLLRRFLGEHLAPGIRYERPYDRPMVTPAASAAGVAVAQAGPVKTGFMLRLERIACHCPTAGATFSIYVGPQSLSTSADPAYRRDYTPTGADNVLDEVNPIHVLPGEYVTYRFTAATSGDVCSIGVQGSEWRLDRPALP